MDFHCNSSSSGLPGMSSTFSELSFKASFLPWYFLQSNDQSQDSILTYHRSFSPSTTHLQTSFSYVNVFTTEALPGKTRSSRPSPPALQTASAKPTSAPGFSTLPRTQIANVVPASGPKYPPTIFHPLSRYSTLRKRPIHRQSPIKSPPRACKLHFSTSSPSSWCAQQGC